MNVLTVFCVSLLGRAVLCGNLRNDDSPGHSEPSNDSITENTPEQGEPMSPELLKFAGAIFEVASQGSSGLKTPIELNLGDQLVDDKVDVHEVTLNNLSHKFYLPKGKHYFTAIKNNGEEVWKAGDGEKCSLAYIYYKPEPVLSFFVYKKEDGEEVEKEVYEFMVQEDNQWKNPTEEVKKQLEGERAGFVKALQDLMEKYVAETGKEAKCSRKSEGSSPEEVCNTSECA